jgi:hypothetical protein
MLLRTIWATSIDAGSCREGGEADAATTVEHARCLVHGIGGARALQYVIQPLAASDTTYRFDGILVTHVDHVIRAQPATDL